MSELLFYGLMLVTDSVAYFTAWILLPVLTLGRVRVEPLIDGSLPQRGRGSIVRQPQGHWMVQAQLAPAIGLLLWAVVGVVCVATL